MQHIEEDYGDNHDTREKIIIDGLRELYLSEILCDATIVTTGKRFPCHRVVLSSVSPYFQVLFTCPMKESQSCEVSLLDIPSSVVKVILDFIYTGDAFLSMENIEELFTVSSRLQIRPMQDLCSRFLTKNMNPENCLWVYRLAHGHNDKRLLDTAIHCISQHLTSLSETEDFLHLELSEVTRILSSDQLMVSSELTIHNLACRWWKYQSTEDNPLPEELLKVVRFPLMTPEELANVNLDIISRNPPQTSTEFHLRQGMFDDLILCTEMEQMIGDENHFHIHSYDPVADSWGKLPFINPLFGHGLVVVGTNLYVSGGMNEKNSASSSLHVYDSIRNGWKELPSMAQPRYLHGFLNHRDALYALGGSDYNETLSSVECFNLIENCWTSTSSLPLPLRGFVSAQFRGKLFLIGGHTDSVKKSLQFPGFLIYDISSDTWSQFPLHAVFLAAGAVVLDDKLYVIGHYDSRHGHFQAYPNYNEYQTYMLYDEEQVSTTRSFCMDHLGRMSQSNIPPIEESLELSSVVVWKHRIYIVGGNGESSTIEMFYWSPGEPRWTTCHKKIPFYFLGEGEVAMQVPMKRFHTLIPGRKSDYNLWTEDDDNKTEKGCWSIQNRHVF
ncbi:kelch repeat and BTB domain-containing protein 8-like [Engystomops pustulosus]|uniref:kelch repeat and BTB domain-containing protein 8-like n=1 Tax=Engystomops pustulosus TaxID=76066 RepID=UPI003AFAC7EB